jgi:peptidyl-prolyl cis-trans isomerase C
LGLSRYVVAGALLLPTLAGCRGDSARAVDPVILALGEQVVRRSDFERHLQALKARGLDGDDAAVRKAVLDAFLEERVLVLEAQSRGLLKPGSSGEAGEAAAQQLLAEAAGSAAGASDEEIAGYYAAHQSELGVPDTIVLRQILVPTENEARDVRRRLAKEPKSFEMLAQTRSRAPEASQGGLMGKFSRGQLPAELEQAAFALAPGTASEPLKTALGYHVLRVDAREAARDRTLDECRSEIRVLIQRQKADEAARQLVRGLLARAKVNYEAAHAVPDAR